MHAAVILVGDELLAGHTRDANGHYLAQRLTALGHALRRITVIPDEAGVIQETVERALATADIVFLSGGLGPTHDDRTTEALAARFGRRLVVDEAGWARLKTRYAKLLPVPPEVEASAKKMVLVPEGAEVLENPLGAASGYLLREGTSILVVLPGVPAEMQAIFERMIVGHVLPQAQARGLLEVDFELPEAMFAAALSDVAREFGDIDIGSYPHFGERRVTLRFNGDPERAAIALEAFYDLVPAARKSALGTRAATTHFNPTRE